MAVWTKIGGKPVTIRRTIGTGGEKLFFDEIFLDTTQGPARGNAAWLTIRNVGASEVRIFSSQGALADGTQYYSLSPVATPPNGAEKWEGPFEGDAIFLQANGGTSTVEILALVR